MQPRGFPARILAEAGLLEQHGGHRILEAHAFVAAHEPGVEEIDLGRLQDRAADVVVPRLYREHDVERLQYVEVALQRGRGRSRAAAGVAPCCSHHSRTEMGCNLNSR